MSKSNNDLRPPSLEVSLVPAADEGWTDVEIKRGERTCVMAHVRSGHAGHFVQAAITALGV